MINRQFLVYIMNILLLIAFLAISVTGLLKLMTLQPATDISSALPMYAISQIHHLAGLALIILVVFHIVFHFRTLVFMTKKHLLRR